ncbi:hypothetical protein OIU74_027904 [Salix koriyanagi]|uniref:Uncharacterized protein n=1 Tax=Salix koriyanagi TaxID=2511006 RepID=A0A9Q0ZZY9_9ROSI|nr:hypothetical protein OIU74_027904 [Salix koriyanagi]
MTVKRIETTTDFVESGKLKKKKQRQTCPPGIIGEDPRFFIHSLHIPSFIGSRYIIAYRLLVSIKILSVYGCVNGSSWELQRAMVELCVAAGGTNKEVNLKCLPLLFPLVPTMPPIET